MSEPQVYDVTYTILSGAPVRVGILLNPPVMGLTSTSLIQRLGALLQASFFPSVGIPQPGTSEYAEVDAELQRRFGDKYLMHPNIEPNGLLFCGVLTDWRDEFDGFVLASESLEGDPPVVNPSAIHMAVTCKNELQNSQFEKIRWDDLAALPWSEFNKFIRLLITDVLAVAPPLFGRGNSEWLPDGEEVRSRVKF